MTINPKHQLWCEKYRPANLEDYVFQDKAHEIAFTQMVNDKSIPHLLLSGVQGSGKTTMAEILLRALEFESADVLIINASDENSVDNMREKIKNFISTFAMGEFKVVLLEEADYLSQPAQAVLRKYMENPDTPARFILTCNYEGKLMPALRSRTQQFRFKAADKNSVTEFAAKILIDEGIEFDLETLDKYIAVGYPDIRKIVNLLQQNSGDGKLLNQTLQAELGDYKFAMIDFIGEDNWSRAREIACANVTDDDWEGVYRFLYENLDKSKKFSSRDNWGAGIVVIAEHLHKNGIVADKEINGAACFIRLSLV